MITTTEQAKYHARKYHDNAKTLVVSECGSIHLNCDVDAACKELDKEKKDYFILKGEKTSKKTA